MDRQVRYSECGEEGEEGAGEGAAGEHPDILEVNQVTAGGMLRFGYGRGCPGRMGEEGVLGGHTLLSIG
ncbi:hypothetical protein GCM10027590_49080 [Nocardiopsis nanhaiensis]